MTAVGIKAGDRVRVRPSHLQDPRIGVVEFVGDQDPRNYGEPYSVGVRLDDGGYRDREVLGFRLSELEPLDTTEHENAPEAAPTATGGDTQDRANGPEHNIQSTSEEQNVMTSIAPTPSPVEPHTSTPRVVVGTDFPAGREVASVTAVDPDGEGALISVRVDEYLTLDDARALADAILTVVSAPGPLPTSSRAPIGLGDKATFTPGRSQRNVIANLCAALDGVELDVETLARLANALDVDPITLIKDPAPAHTEEV